VDVPGDGNCMFHSIAVSVGLHEKMPLQGLVRFQIVEEVLNNFQRYRHLVTEEEEVIKMYKDKEWGTEWCLKAAANVYERTVHALAYIPGQDHVVSNNGASFAGMWKYTFFEEGTAEYSGIREKDIVLLCINDNHYNVVVPLGSLAAATAAAKALRPSTRTMVGNPTLRHERQLLTSDGGGVSADGTRKGKMDFFEDANVDLEDLDPAQFDAMIKTASATTRDGLSAKKEVFTGARPSLAKQKEAKKSENVEGRQKEMPTAKKEEEEMTMKMIASEKDTKAENRNYRERGFSYLKKNGERIPLGVESIVRLQLEWVGMSTKEQDEERERVKKEGGGSRKPKLSKTMDGSDVKICYPWILNRLTTKQKIPKEERHKDGDEQFRDSVKGAVTTGSFKVHVENVCKSGSMGMCSLEDGLAAFGITDLKVVEDKRKARAESNSKNHKEKRSKKKDIMIPCSCTSLYGADYLCKLLEKRNEEEEEGDQVRGIAPASSYWYSMRGKLVHSLDDLREAEKGTVQLINGRCFLVACGCKKKDCKAPFEVDGVRMGPATHLWLDAFGVVVHSFREGVVYYYGKCVLVACGCKKKDCKAPFEVDGVRMGPATHLWLDAFGVVVYSFREGVVYFYCKCVLVACGCKKKDCKAPFLLDGVRMGPASHVWLNALGVRVYSFREGVVYFYGKCVLVACGCGKKDDCKAPFLVDGVRMAPATHVWLDAFGVVVHSFREGVVYFYGKCVLVACGCGKKDDCKAPFLVDGVRMAPATHVWLDAFGVVVHSFREGVVYFYGTCVTRTCHACDLQGNACSIRTRSPLDPSQFVCEECKYLDLFPNNQPCPFCGDVWADSTINPDSMRRWLESVGIEVSYWAKFRAEEELSRLACADCFEDAANEVLSEKNMERARAEREAHEASGITQEEMVKEISRLATKLLKLKSEQTNTEVEEE
jgi:hypothetical protein